MARLHIREVEDKGDLENERLVLKAAEDVNIGWYVAVDATFDEDGPSNLGRHAYKFPKKNILKDDFVVVYTRRRRQNETTEVAHSNGKNKTHFFFWGRGITVWNQGGDNCTLLYIVDSKSV